MQVSSKLLFKTAVVMLGLLLAMAVLVGLSTTQKAEALSSSEWNTVRTAIDSYITGQYVAGDEGEAGFTIDAGNLQPRLNSNGDGAYLGEGDDAALAPVLVDNLVAQNNVIPGTSTRCLWNGTAATGCLEEIRLNVIKSKVDARTAAGFSNDVVVYCLTAHTETPVVGGLGIIANAGGLSSGATPRVVGLKWGRNGWTNTPKTYLAAGTLGSPSAPSTYAPASNAMTECNGKTGSELVRCTAAWAIRATGGNVGNGNASHSTSAATIDVRTGNLAGKAIPGSVQIPINTLFNTGLANLNPGGAKKEFVSRTQLGGIVAIGAEMLGYDSAFLQWGLPNYNSSLDEKQVTNSHPTYATIPATANNLDSGVDQTAPTVSSVDTLNIDKTSADIHRAANEPATMKVEYGIASGAYTSTLNNTVLNAHKTVTLTGLAPNTTYYYQVTSYDGQANGTASAEKSFTTLPDDTNPPVITIPDDTTVEATSAAGAVYSYPSSAVDPEEGPVPVNCVPASGSTFPLGDTYVNCTASDSKGNTATDGFTVSVVDTTAPVVSYTGPNGTVTVDNPTIIGLANDIVTVPIEIVSLSLNSAAPITCTVDGSGNVSCPTSGLADGPYSAVLTATDGAGNSSTATGSFVVDTCTGAKPLLSVATRYAYWESYAAYEARELSVRMNLTNSGPNGAFEVAINGATSTNGVLFVSASPIGDIAPGASAESVVKYSVPSGVAKFYSTIAGSAKDECGNGYTYP